MQNTESPTSTGENAQPHDLVVPNGAGKPDGHFLRKLKATAMRVASKAPNSTASARPTPTRCTKKVFR